ncbi:MAG: alpha/beta hydrolase [Gemmatimonadaceae bacterium]
MRSPSHANPPDHRRLPAIALMLIIAIVLAVAGVLFLAWWRQERITFQPPPPPFEDPGDTPRVQYAAADGTRLFAFLVGTPSADRGLILAFHGNADLAVWQIPWARELAARSGWQVMLAEYRGYGGAEGSPTYANAQEDSRAALRYAIESLRIPASRLVLFGHSLGSAVATELATEVNPAALVLQSPFTSARDMARIIVAPPITVAWRLISRIHYDTETRVAALGVPVHVAHGDRDLIVPVRMGRRVHAAAKEKGQLLIINGAGHNDVEDRGGERYWDFFLAALMGVSAVP